MTGLDNIRHLLAEAPAAWDPHRAAAHAEQQKAQALAAGFTVEQWDDQIARCTGYAQAVPWHVDVHAEAYQLLREHNQPVDPHTGTWYAIHHVAAVTAAKPLDVADMLARIAALVLPVGGKPQMPLMHPDDVAATPKAAAGQPHPAFLGMPVQFAPMPPPGTAIIVPGYIQPAWEPIPMCAE